MAARRQAFTKARQILALRAAARAALPLDARRRIEEVEHTIRSELGPSVPKRQAAELLGVSVTTLDKWVARGAIPIVVRGGSSRAEIESEALLALARELEQGRESAAAPLATAVAGVARRHTSERQIVEAAKLSQALTAIASAPGRR